MDEPDYLQKAAWPDGSSRFRQGLKTASIFFVGIIVVLLVLVLKLPDAQVAQEKPSVELDYGPPITDGVPSGPPETETITQESVPVETLEIEVLKVYATSRSHSAADVRFINTSSRHLAHWAVSLEVYDSAGRYLGEDKPMVSHIRPGESKIEQAIFLDISAGKIANYAVTLGGIVGESGLRIDEQFVLATGEAGVEATQKIVTSPPAAESKPRPTTSKRKATRSRPQRAPRVPRICTKCNGVGLLACTHCNGAGTVSAQFGNIVTCWQCGGSGQTRCRICHGRGTR